MNAVAYDYDDAVLESFAEGERLRVMTISRAVDLWLGELERKGRRERTIDHYRRLLDKLSDEHPQIDVDELTPHMIRRFLDAQARRRNGTRKSDATIANNVTIINTFFDWLTAEGITKRNSVRRNGERIISRPRQVAPDENDNVVTVSSDEVRRLLDTSRRMGWNRMLTIHALVYLGPRRSAISSARIGDYDPEGRTLVFREKGGKTIRKPVPDALADIIDAGIRDGRYETTDDYLIPSDARQRRATGDRDSRFIWRVVKDVAEEAGVTSHVHALRAAFAVQYLTQNPGQVIALQKLMGHRRVETTMVYLRRLDRAQQMESVRSLSWDAPASPQIADKEFESLPLTEKEGFEPSFDPTSLLKRAGTQPAIFAPGKGRQRA